MTVSNCGSVAGASVTTSIGDTNGIVTATVSGTLPDGTPFSQTLGPITVLPFGEVTASACAN